jgi:hypothetical protein
MKALTSLLTHDHGSTDYMVRLCHEVFRGPPDLDPGTSPKWNERINAKRIITEEMDARVSPWFEGAPLPHRLLTDRRCRPGDEQGETVFNNPGNDKQGKLVAFYWKTDVEFFLRGWARSVMYVGFNIEQASRLQRVGARTSPLKWPTIIPAERPEYLDGETLQPQTEPAHASLITLLSRDPREIKTFAALGRELGDVVNVHGY